MSKQYVTHSTDTAPDNIRFLIPFVAQHPDKTIIGRIRGFDFLGYRFSAAGLAIAQQTVERYAEKVSRLSDRVS